MGRRTGYYSKQHLYNQERDIRRQEKTRPRRGDTWVITSVMGKMAGKPLLASSLVLTSCRNCYIVPASSFAPVVELVDAIDSKSIDLWSWGFKSLLGHQDLPVCQHLPCDYKLFICWNHIDTNPALWGMYYVLLVVIGFVIQYCTKP